VRIDSEEELRRVEEVLQTHDRYPLEKLQAAVQRSLGRQAGADALCGAVLHRHLRFIVMCASWRCWSGRWNR